MSNYFFQTLSALTLIFVPSLALAQGEDAAPGTEIIVTGRIDPGEVEALGKAVVRPSRAGKPIARFDAPVCVKVSGIPDDMATLVEDRIQENIRSLVGVDVADEGCSPNAFVGVLNGVNSTVDQLRKDEKWLFEGLLDYQIDRIYDGSDAVRAWHVFDVRNLDGSAIPGSRPGGSVNDLVNRVEKASRRSQLRVNLVGAVVLVETGSLREKTFRQLADYATMRILASTSDEVSDNPGNVPTILELFGNSDAPNGLSEFDRSYLAALYELPANSLDGQIINSAVRRYRYSEEVADSDEN
ncbi:hypothetical protein [Qipengyuania sp. JC766]|uniref:hypothetical protein n=1 Tax=Qipengyuania sp. JC766 TaxID=3232139 RepID=UPI00345862A9